MMRMADLMEANNKATRLNSTIQIKPQVDLPQLSDTDMDIQDFFTKFEDVMQLANCGRGTMSWERCHVLKGCLKGANRLLAFEETVRELKATGVWDRTPDVAYERLKERLMRFALQPMERQHLLISRFEQLTRGRMSAVEWEPIWERALAELRAVGIDRNDKDLAHTYFQKTLPNVRARIMNDKRLYGSEGVQRGPQTWREAHTIALELDVQASSCKALDTVPTPAYRGRGDHVNAGQEAPAPKPQCFKWLEGNCDRADCRYEHAEGKRGSKARGKGAAPAPKSKGAGSQ